MDYWHGFGGFIGGGEEEGKEKIVTSEWCSVQGHLKSWKLKPGTGVNTDWNIVDGVASGTCNMAEYQMIIDIVNLTILIFLIKYMYNRYYIIVKISEYQ